MATAECCCCFQWFKLERSYVRFHNDHRGNVCPGSGLEPRVPLLSVWDAMARRAG